jgi:hypothetical protein
VHNFHIKRFTVLPAKANPPLIVDPNAVLASPVSAEPL